MSEDDLTQDGPVLVIGNEFANVWVRKVKTNNGERLEIHCPDKQTTIRVDALQLEALSAQGPEEMAKLLDNEADS